MKLEDLEAKLGISDLSEAEKLALVKDIQANLPALKAEQMKLESQTQAQMVIAAVKKIQENVENRFNELSGFIENKAAKITSGKDGIQGPKGEKGDKGERGADGYQGRDGKDGKDGEKGDQGVGVADARVDFDGSLVITLTDGTEIDAGEVLPLDTTEKLKVYFNNPAISGSSLPDQTGNSGKFLTTNGTDASWATVVGGLSYQGTWNATSNTPTLASSTGTNGYYYIVAIAGSTNLNGITDWQIGDWLLFNGSTWQKLDQTNLVTSVAGRTGAVTLSTSDISGLGTIATQATNNVNITGGSITGITDLAVADGGTGSSTASGARTNLGLVIGTDVLAPNGSAASLTSFPTLNQNTTGTASNVTGTVAIANGGTGQTTASAAFNALAPVTSTGDLIVGNGTNSSTRLAIGTNGYVLTSNGTTATWSAASGGGGLTKFTEAESTSAPNDTVYVDSLTATASSTNADVVFAAKGSGATLAHIPTSTTAGGNKRGPYATDWQKVRYSASAVASGYYSTIGGGVSNYASGSGSTVAGGYNCRSEGAYSTISGGSSNSASTTQATVSGGDNNTASGTGSTIGGGTGNTASGSNSVALGDTNTASGGQAVALGGQRNIASGTWSYAYGGGATTRGISGYFATAACVEPIAGSNFRGVSQSGLLILGRATTDATATVLTSTASAASTTNQVILPNNSAYYFKGTVVAGKTAGGDTKGWTIEGVIKRGADAASTALVGVATVTSTYADAGAATWTIAAAADTTNGGLKITATGQAATTIRWVCKIETTEMTF